MDSPTPCLPSSAIRLVSPKLLPVRTIVFALLEHCDVGNHRIPDDNRRCILGQLQTLPDRA